MDQLHQTFRPGAPLGLVLGRQQELAHPAVVGRRLGKCLDDDGRLFEFNPKAEVDDGMEKPWWTVS